MKNSFDTPWKTINCPQCGAKLPLYIKYAKLANCQYCGSVIFIEDEASRLAGYSSVLTPEPSLIELNKPFSYAGSRYMPIGRIRYSYGRGFWEEWWLKDANNEQYWLSIDEGDFVLEKEVPNRFDIDFFKNPHIGQKIGDEWIVTEIGTGKCEGFSGVLPWDIKMGESHSYVQLSGYHSRMMTVELDDDGMKSFEGSWIDPFELKVDK